MLVGDDPASALYVGGKQRGGRRRSGCGLRPPAASRRRHAEVEALLRELNADPARLGILLQLPTPRPGRRRRADAADRPGKDVDGLTPVSAGLLAKGRPGAAALHAVGRDGAAAPPRRALEGAEAVVVGRSDLVGKPVAALLLAANATVTICHSRTRDLAAVCRRADVLVAAVGRPELVRGDWVKPGAVVIDVGINRTDDGLVGDVDFEPAAERAGLITPVPGGVGPMTIAMLLRNTLEAAERAQAVPA